MPETMVRTSLSPNNHTEKKNLAHVKCAAINICDISLYEMSQNIAPSHNQLIILILYFWVFSVYCINKNLVRRQTGMDVTHQC